MPASPETSQPQSPSAVDRWAGRNARGWVGAVLALLLVALIWVGWEAARSAISRAEIQLPLLAIAGVLILLVALALTSVSFATFGIDDRSEALALPSGSVRAVIALSLVVIFSILTVYLFATLSSAGSTELVTDLTAAQRDSFLTKFSSEQLTHISSRATGSAAAPTPTAATTQGAARTPAAATDARVPTYSVYNDVGPSQASQDFAKQLLAMLGVLLSSVTGFYFGAKTAAQANDKTPPDAGSNTKTPPAGADATPAAAGGSGAQQRGDPAKLSSTNVAVTPDAAALGHDPSLASDPSADDLNKGTS